MDEIELYRDRTPLSSHPTMVALQSLFQGLQVAVERIDDVERLALETAQRQQQMALNAASSRDWMDLLAFVNRYKVRPMDTDNRTLSFYGTKITRWCEKQGIPVKRRSSFHERYGSVNSYPASALVRYFNEEGFQYDLDLYTKDHDLR